MNRLHLAGLLAIVAIGSGASGFVMGRSTPYTVANPAPTVTVTASPKPTDSGAPVSNEPSPKEGVLKYGQTYVWGDFNLETTVAKPRPVKVTNSAGRKYQDFVEYTVTIKNASKDKWTQVHLPLLFHGDGERYSGQEPRELAPGKSVTVKLVYGVPDPLTTEAQIEIAPDFAAPITWK